MVAMRPLDPALRRRITRPTAIAGALFTLSLAGVALNALVVSPSPFGDLRIYQLEGSAVRHGADLYGRLPGVDGLATYPPFAGLLFTATTPLPFVVLSTLNLLATGAALGWAGVAVARLCGAQRQRAITAGLAAAAIGLLSEPLLMTVHYGQINVYLMALVLWDFTRAPGSRVSGIGIGLAAAIKVTPAVFVIYLLATRRFAMAGRAVAAFAVTIAVSLAVDARATAAFWTDHLFDTRRVGHVENAVNQSIRGWLVRAHHSHAIPSAELLIVVAAAILGLVTAVRVYRVAGDRWGVPAAAVTGLLCSPIAWSHHWVWCVPILLLLWFEHRYLLLAAGAVIFFSWAVWTIPHGGMTAPVELHLTWWQVLLSGWYVLFGLAFLSVTLRRAAQP